MSRLPIPDQDARQASQQLAQHITQQIRAAGGWMPFSDYMHAALYTAGLGYYSGGAQKFGADGDFVTAPEISPLFAQSLADQLAEVLRETGGDVLELGAGRGRLAAQLLLALEALQCLPVRYLILEVSAQLRAEQQAHIARLPQHLAQRVHWLDGLPEALAGVVIGNEVLDALPVEVLELGDTGWNTLGVAEQDDGFIWQARPLLQTPAAVQGMDLPPGYITEHCPAASALVSSLAERLAVGLLLFIDYGFARAEYYHPQRRQGTLMCHYRHHAHGDPFFYPGLQDITAHVDFSAVAEAAAPTLDLLGYAGQAQFLINCGITEHLAAVSAADAGQYLPLAAAAQKLLSPAEMGELFKVIALGRGIQAPLRGFRRGDRSHTL
ncbi:class I SAM-dependent methyltransferase [Pseudomethylobacillus aquaticus]|uniref:Class I SAM-dependent methyltransferase n=1 Tax=Pseudomethylobacillus aquaticus TaxID=2676064 RepID=A0A3N0UZZ4_9PROT|nr:SAM-dependent methyltransferase [Pseudomethylobacillus aquaticus]ROH85864.1 class I SAM-dependent methyltransferase [Pseudomethylobacillus aquaticus]